jgi:uncharacterized membrane protein
MRIIAAIKNSFVAGLILITPLVVTLYILRILANWSLQLINPVVQGTRLTQYTANIEAVAQILAVVLIVAAITFLGYLAQKAIGQRMFGNVGRIVNVIPLVNTIYTSVRQVADSLVNRDTAYESCVLVEYPRENCYSIGLVTGNSPKAIDEFDDQEVYNVFLPHSPNPTAGRLLLLPADQIHETDMSVRQGMRLIVTTGIGSDTEPSAIPELQHVSSGT